LQVAVALQRKVYLEADKWAVMQCVELPPAQRALLTRNVNEAGLHVMPMAHVRGPLLLCTRIHGCVSLAPV
jgi:hypothetical protein